jgi:hypothetical protein
MDCEIKSEGKKCFSGLVILKLAGNIIEDGKLINCNFILPSGNQASLLLERQ